MLCGGGGREGVNGVMRKCVGSCAGSCVLLVADVGGAARRCWSRKRHTSSDLSFVLERLQRDDFVSERDELERGEPVCGDVRLKRCE